MTATMTASKTNNTARTDAFRWTAQPQRRDAHGYAWEGELEVTSGTMQDAYTISWCLWANGEPVFTVHFFGREYFQCEVAIGYNGRVQPMTDAPTLLERLAVAAINDAQRRNAR